MTLHTRNFEAGIRFSTPYRYEDMCFVTSRSNTKASFSDNQFYFFNPFHGQAWITGWYFFLASLHNDCEEINNKTCVRMSAAIFATGAILSYNLISHRLSSRLTRRLIFTKSHVVLVCCFDI